MSHSSSNSSSSLLQQHRPPSLQPQPHSSDTEQTMAQRIHLETHESRHLNEPFVVTPKARSRANSNSKSQSDSLSLNSRSSSLNIHLSSSNTPIPSSSSGMNYLNQNPTMYISNDIAHPELPCLTDEPCSVILEAVRDGSIGHSISQDQWQPDCSSALCTYPFCSTIFTPSSSYFAFGPRRHHCRKCGLIFCSSHSNNKAPLYDQNHQLIKQRVCDLCIHKDTDTSSSYPRSRRPSLSSSDCPTDSSISAEYLLTPSDVSLSRTSTRTHSSAPSTPNGSLAPVQEWMDSEGVLSLYPLALPSVHRRLAVPAARPLFCPSQAAVRIAKEREDLAVLSFRQRRIGRERQMNELQQSRRGSMESVEEEVSVGTLTKRSASQERMAQSTF